MNSNLYQCQVNISLHQCHEYSQKDLLFILVNGYFKETEVQSSGIVEIICTILCN